MTKSELIDKLLNKYPHLYQRDVETLVNTILSELSDSIASGRRVELRGFGSFSLRHREARAARNPKNGEIVQVGARSSIYFRPGKELKEKVNA